MAVWTATQVGAQTVFYLEDISGRSAATSKLMQALNFVRSTAFDTGATAKSGPPLVSQIIDMAPPRRFSLEENSDDTYTMPEDECAPSLHRNRLIVNSLGKISHSVDGTVITFEPKKGGSVTFVQCDGKATIIAVAPDGSEKRYPTTMTAFEAARRIRDLNVNWLGGLHFSFEPSCYEYKSASGKVEVTVKDIEYSETGFVSGFSVGDDRWQAVAGTAYFECVDVKGKRISALPLQIGPIVMKADGLHASGLDSIFDIGVPFRRPNHSGSTAQIDARPVKASTSIKKSLSAQTAACPVSTWQKTAKERHLQSVALLSLRRKPQANQVS